MVDKNGNDNDVDRSASGRRSPDAHGQAAMLLVESLIHGLIARSVISSVDAISIVDTAAEVKIAVADELGDTQHDFEKSLSLLHAIGDSLKIDLIDG